MREWFFFSICSLHYFKASVGVKKYFIVFAFKELIVKTTVIERDYGLIQMGQSAEVMVDGFPDKRFSGKVSQIAPLLQETFTNSFSQMEEWEQLMILSSMSRIVKMMSAESIDTLPDTDPGSITVTS